MKKQYLRAKLAVIISLTVLIIACLIGLVACSKKDQPLYQPYTYNLHYSADSNGSLIGETNQCVIWFANATEVTAVPNEGYIFAGWSDDTFLITRKDTNITEDIDVCAKFVSKTKTLKYEYNGATSNNNATDITLDYDNLTDLSFAIPAKANYEFQGWYLDKELTRRVTDKDGVYYLGKSIFYSDSDTLYARWETREGIVYPVLMLFIGDIDARFEDSSKRFIYSIKHELTISELKFSELLAPVLSGTLNEWFEGKVYFEFDSFFTVSPIGVDSFYPGYFAPPTTNIGHWGAYLQTPSVSEVAPILKNYRSVLTSYCDIAVSETSSGLARSMYDCAGIAGNKYGELFMSKQYYYDYHYDKSKPLSGFLNNDLYWESVKDSYYHEFVHTIEQGIGLDDYHDWEGYYSKDHNEMGGGLKATKLYLLNEAEMNGTMTGIPFSFWEGGLPVKYYYCSQRYYGMGNIKLIDENVDKTAMNLGGTLPYGSSVTVEAIPNEGYRFVGWSDGVTTARRTDENIISYLYVYAIFEAYEV